MGENGLLDFIKTPEGQGLLSAAFAGLAGARRGQPLNSLGRAGLAGLQGYAGAVEAEQKLADNEFQKKYRTLQMTQLEQQMASEKAKQAFLGGLLQAPTTALQQGAAVGDVGPTKTNAQRLESSMPPGLGRIPRDALQAEIALNKGENISKWMYETGKPDIVVQNGVAIDRNRVTPGFVPGINVSTDGKATMTTVDPATGMPVISAPKGALDTFTNYQLASELPKAVIGSAGRVNLRKNADGTEMPVVELTENPVLGQLYSQILGGGMPGTQPQSAAPQATAPAASTSPALQPQRPQRSSIANPADADRYAILTQERAKAVQEGRAADVQSLDREISRLPSTARVGTNPSGLTVNAMPRYGISTQQQQSNDTVGKINDSWIKSTYEPTIASGSTAGDILTNVTIARDALGKLGTTGWGTEARATAANVLVGLGVGSDNAKMFAANAEKFQNVAMTNLQKTLNEAKGPQTEGDATRASKTYAQLKNTAQANEFILDITEAKALRDKMKADFYREALPLAQKKGDLAEVDREWAKRAPSVFTLPSMQRWNIK